MISHKLMNRASLTNILISTQVTKGPCTHMKLMKPSILLDCMKKQFISRTLEFLIGAGIICGSAVMLNRL